MTTIDNIDYLTTKETADLLECTTQHIAYLVKNKRLAKYKLLGKALFIKSDVENLLKPQRVTV